MLRLPLQQGYKCWAFRTIAHGSIKMILCPESVWERIRLKNMWILCRDCEQNIAMIFEFWSALKRNICRIWSKRRMNYLHHIRSTIWYWVSIFWSRNATEFIPVRRQRMKQRYRTMWIPLLQGSSPADICIWLTRISLIMLEMQRFMSGTWQDFVSI